MSKNYKKVTFSIPASMWEDLTYLSERMGISRSALLVNLSSDGIHDMTVLARDLPENPTAADILRSRGQSEALIKERMLELPVTAGWVRRS